MGEGGTAAVARVKASQLKEGAIIFYKLKLDRKSVV